jgi:hypothetical protein
MIIRLTDRPDNTKSFAEVSYPIALGEQLIYQSAGVGVYIDDPNVITITSFFQYYMPKKLGKLTRYDTIRRFSVFTMDSAQKEIGVFLVDGEQLQNTFPTFLTQFYIPLNSMAQLKQYALYTFYIGKFYENLKVEMYNRPLKTILQYARPSVFLQKYSILNTLNLNQYVVSNLMIIFAIRPVAPVPNPVIYNNLPVQIFSMNVELHEVYLTPTTDTEEAKFFAKLYKPYYVNLF